MLDSLTADQTQKLVQTLVVTVGLIAGYLIVARLGRRTVNRVSQRGDDGGARAATLWSMMRRLLLVAVAVTLVLTVASIWSIPSAPFLAVGSAVGVAVGFGAQDLVRDVIAGFFILAEDQYHIVDVVRVAGVAGAVEDIRPRVTVLRDLDGNVHYVPNGQIKVASNLTHEFAQVVLDISVSYDAPVDHVLVVLADELIRMSEDEAWSAQILEPPQVLGVDQLGDSAVVVRAVLRVAAEERWNVKREALRRVKKRFDDEGIEIPYPMLNVIRRDHAETERPPSAHRADS